MSDHLDLLQRATICLSQDGPIKDRLAQAYASHLVPLESAELPEGLREDFGVLSAAMHRVTPEVRESDVRASVRKMSVDEASAYAALVVRLFAAIARTEAAQPNGARAVRAMPATVMQLFAAEG